MGALAYGVRILNMDPYRRIADRHEQFSRERMRTVRGAIRDLEWGRLHEQHGRAPTILKEGNYVLLHPVVSVGEGYEEVDPDGRRYSVSAREAYVLNGGIKVLPENFFLQRWGGARVHSSDDARVASDIRGLLHDVLRHQHRRDRAISRR